MFILSFLFFIIATLYSFVGFGGGSSYTALLGVSDISYELIPKISLTCNLIVVSGGLWNFYRHKKLEWTLAKPFLVSSVPMALLGGSFPVTEKFFYLMLGITLSIAGLRLIFIKAKEQEQITRPKGSLTLLTGGVIGLISGMVGIGGGIFLSPLIINLGWARSKQAASIACLFIFFNSLAGLLGQMIKGTPTDFNLNFIFLFVAVFIGGQIGSRLSLSAKVSYKLTQIATAILTLAVGLRVLIRLI